MMSDIICFLIKILKNVSIEARKKIYDPMGLGGFNPAEVLYYVWSFFCIKGFD